MRNKGGRAKGGRVLRVWLAENVGLAARPVLSCVRFQ